MLLVKTKKKKVKVSALKKKLWKLTSLYVRLENSSNGYVNCVSCGRNMHWKESQAGHFVPKAQGNSIYFDLRNIHPQCYRCNINLGGNQVEYFVYMENKYGREVIEELRALSKTTLKITVSDYNEMIIEMKDRLKSLPQD